jgi:hypothetical protein
MRWFYHTVNISEGYCPMGSHYNGFLATRLKKVLVVEDPECLFNAFLELDNVSWVGLRDLEYGFRCSVNTHPSRDVVLNSIMAEDTYKFHGINHESTMLTNASLSSIQTIVLGDNLVGYHYSSGDLFRNHGVLSRRYRLWQLDLTKDNMDATDLICDFDAEIVVPDNPKVLFIYVAYEVLSSQESRIQVIEIVIDNKLVNRYLRE